MTVKLRLSAFGSWGLRRFCGLMVAWFLASAALASPTINSIRLHASPEKTRLGPSANRCFKAAVLTAMKGIESKHTITTNILETILITFSLGIVLLIRIPIPSNSHPLHTRHLYRSRHPRFWQSLAFDMLQSNLHYSYLLSERLSSNRILALRI